MTTVICAVLGFGGGCQSDLRAQLEARGAAPVGLNATRDAAAGDAGVRGDDPLSEGDAGAPTVEQPTPRACPPGTFVVFDQEAATRSCEGCASGTFSTDEDAAECATWTECQPGEFIEVKGSASEDQTCAACPEDQTSTTLNAASCLPLGACPSGTVQVSVDENDDPECEPCEAGSFCAGGTTLAHPCAEGTWDHDADPATDCVDQTICPAGRFVETPGTESADRVCGDCAEGSFSLATNASECTPHMRCVEGTFLALAGSATMDTTCETCSPGSFTDSQNEAACRAWTECEPGQFVATSGTASNDRQCESCAADHYSDVVNASSCVAVGQCAPGTRQTEAGSEDRPAACEACAPGEYCAGTDVPAETCVAGTWDHDADPATPCVEHTSCLAGSYLAAMGDATTDQSCAPCDDGSFSADVDVLACQTWQECPAGTYVQTLGSSTTDVACAGCASGSFTDEVGEASCAMWTDCQPGQFVEAAGTATSDRDCAACPSGQYSASLNAGTCVDADECPPGTVETAPATQTAPAECDDCASGTYCAGGQADEVACNSNSWDDDQDPATPCVPKTTCAAGQFVQSAGNATTDRSCSPCAAGRFSTTQNAASCQTWQNCSAGKYVETAGSSTADRVCTNCASGAFSTTQNAASCTTWSTCAAPNYYMSTAGSPTTNRVCTACTPPQITSSNNETACHTPAFQMSGGTVVMEAENYTSYNQNGSQHTWGSATVSGTSGNTVMHNLPDAEFMWDDRNAVPAFAPRLVYNVNFTTTGTFYVFIRADDSGGTDTDNTCWAGIDNVPAASQHAFATPTGTFIWVSQQVTVSTTGIHTLTVWPREDGFRFDKIVVSTSSTAPSGLGPSQSSYN